jgi:hypothetical protein
MIRKEQGLQCLAFCGGQDRGLMLEQQVGAKLVAQARVNKRRRDWRPLDSSFQ